MCVCARRRCNYREVRWWELNQTLIKGFGIKDVILIKPSWDLACDVINDKMEQKIKQEKTIKASERD